MQHWSRTALLAPLGIALLAPAGAQARAMEAGAGVAASTPVVTLKSVSSPPAAALVPGERFTLKGKVTNHTKKSAKPRVTITTLSSKKATPHTLVKKTLASVKKGKTGSYSITVKLASSAVGRLVLRARLCRPQRPQGELSLRHAQADRQEARRGARAPTPTPTAVPQPAPTSHHAAEEPKPFKVLVFTTRDDATTKCRHRGDPGDREREQGQAEVHRRRAR